MPWIVAMSKPNQEGIAEINLQRQGFTYYCPRYKHKVGIKVSVKPLFPRYLFILIDKIWSPIHSTRGISYVLLRDEGPQTISEQVIMSIKAREVRGLVDLDPAPKFLCGDRLKTDVGPLAGHLLLFEGMSSHERVKVLVELLGRKVIVELPEKVLVAA